MTFTNVPLRMLDLVGADGGRRNTLIVSCDFAFVGYAVLVSIRRMAVGNVVTVCDSVTVAILKR